MNGYGFPDAPQSSSESEKILESRWLLPDRSRMEHPRQVFIPTSNRGSYNRVNSLIEEQCVIEGGNTESCQVQLT